MLQHEISDDNVSREDAAAAATTAFLNRGNLVDDNSVDAIVQHARFLLQEKANNNGTSSETAKRDVYLQFFMRFPTFLLGFFQVFQMCTTGFGKRKK